MTVPGRKRIKTSMFNRVMMITKSNIPTVEKSQLRCMPPGFFYYFRKVCRAMNFFSRVVPDMSRLCLWALVRAPILRTQKGPLPEGHRLDQTGGRP